MSSLTEMNSWPQVWHLNFLVSLPCAWVFLGTGSGLSKWTVFARFWRSWETSEAFGPVVILSTRKISRQCFLFRFRTSTWVFLGTGSGFTCLCSFLEAFEAFEPIVSLSTRTITSQQCFPFRFRTYQRNVLTRFPSSRMRHQKQISSVFSVTERINYFNRNLLKEY